jgi:hypothetical protein
MVRPADSFSMFFFFLIPMIKRQVVLCVCSELRERVRGQDGGGKGLPCKGC